MCSSPITITPSACQLAPPSPHLSSVVQCTHDSPALLLFPMHGLPLLITPRRHGSGRSPGTLGPLLLSLWLPTHKGGKRRTTRPPQSNASRPAHRAQMNPVWSCSPPPWTLFTYSGHLGTSLALNTSEMVGLNVFSNDPWVMFTPVQATEAL